MPRKRTRLPKKSSRNNRQTTSVKKTIVTKKKYDHKKLYTAVMLIGIFCLVLFFNSYFNYTSGIAFNPEGDTIGTKFYLSGPDPYYNMRLCEQTLERGYYPFVGDDIDPLLNYPIGKSNPARPPLFNMIAVGVAKMGGAVMDEMDALGWAMLFLPAIYGALLIFPIYGIGKQLFNKRVGLIAALFVPLIPVHIGAGHGSSFSLFDHDSFLLLLTMMVIYFLIKSLKEKDLHKSIMYAMASGVFIASMEMSWVAAEFIFVLLIIFMVVQMFFDIINNKISMITPMKTSIALSTGFLISIPYILIKNNMFDFPFYAMIVSVMICLVYYVLKKIRIPWIVSIPAMFSFGGLFLALLYMINQGAIKVSGFFNPLTSISSIVYGTGIYGSKVSITIGESNAPDLSLTVMSFGPMLFWLAMAGFILFAIHTYQKKWEPHNVLFLTLFIIDIWLLTTAGRFINDLMPTIAIFAAYITYMVIKKVNYKDMIKNIRSVGGFQKIKVIKLSQAFCIVFIMFLLLPNAYCSLDAAVPPQKKADVFGADYQGAWGLVLNQQIDWADACNWLSQQDTDIENPADRPGFISWWDYGFYEASMGQHPTVADNFQDGIPPAGNFHTSKSESEAISVLIIRLAEAVKMKHFLINGTYKLSEDVVSVFEKYLGNESVTLTNIIENPEQYAPSYDTLIAPEWGNTILHVTPNNAMYHDGCDVMLVLSDEGITMFYRDMIDVTGYSIRYYGVESYDTQIFGVFSFLSDKGTFGYVTAEDDYTATVYTDALTNNQYTYKQIENMTDDELRSMDLRPSTVRKEGFFNTMFFRTFYGISIDGQISEYRFPTYGLRHFVPVYFSPRIIITKYYSGARINGTAHIGSMPYINANIYVMDEMLGLPHDGVSVDGQGHFSVIAPAGNITLKLFVGENEIDSITFNTIENPPITEEEAMRYIDTNRTVSFNIDMSSVNGAINITDVNITLTITGMNTHIEKVVSILNNTYYVDEILPDTYQFIVTNETGFEIYNEQYFLSSGNNTYNIIATAE